VDSGGWLVALVAYPQFDCPDTAASRRWSGHAQNGMLYMRCIHVGRASAGIFVVLRGSP